MTKVSKDSSLDLQRSREAFSFRHTKRGQGEGSTGAQTNQCELHPKRAPSEQTLVPRALPHVTRAFGKLVDTTPLAPGDLLLTRELSPDRISKLIAKVQSSGGYGEADARWTHAAMYLGDGMSVVEATFDSVREGGSVRISSLDGYCTGAHSIRVRRSRFVSSERQGWRICVRAMSRLGRPYNFMEALIMWFKVMFQGRGFYDADERQSTSAAVICSMLYADSYNEATRRCLGEINGVCVPAWLSVADEFEDIQAEWLKISH